ncbi:MAG: hypothetical protein Kow0099_37890 [Candidatus Abyssubacteria bacterium]
MFNIHNRQELCPASFYGAYHILLREASRTEGNFRGARGSVHCPDPFGVCYSYEGAETNCEEFLSLRVRVTDEFGRCPRGHHRGDQFSVSTVLHEKCCPLAFHAIYPYYLTLVHAGRFEWVRKGDCVKVQCPKADGVVMGVRPVRQAGLGESAVKVEVLEVKGSCPKNCEPGDTFDIDSNQQPFCFQAMAGLIPFRMILEKDWRYSCPGTRNSLIFEVGTT